MKPVDISRPLFAMAVSGLLLAACEQAQQLQQPTNHAQALQSTRLSPQVRKGDLLYLPGGCGGTCIISYPPANWLGMRGPEHTEPAATAGEHFIADGNAFDEYSHGGTEPINTFPLRGSFSCGIDPHRGNIA